MTSTSVAKRPTELLAPQLDYVLMDGSGSMKSKWWEMLGCLQMFVNVMKKENINSHGIISVFDSNDLQSIQRTARLADWKDFDVEPIGGFWGSTPLFDAIVTMGFHLRELKPEKCSIIIVTDGQEAGSHQYTVEQARATLDWCRAQGWQVTFIGCDFENSTQAKLLGATEDNTVAVAKHKLEDAGAVLARKRAMHARNGDDISFSQKEKSEFGGYLTHQA